MRGAGTGVAVWAVLTAIAKQDGDKGVSEDHAVPSTPLSFRARGCGEQRWDCAAPLTNCQTLREVKQAARAENAAVIVDDPCLRKCHIGGLCRNYSFSDCE